MSDLTLTRGDDESLTVLVQSPVADADGLEPDEDGWTPTYEPENITLMTGWWFVKRKKSDADADALVTLTTEDDIDVVTDGANGNAVITVADTTTDTLGPGVYFWEFQGLLGEAVRTLAAGRLRLTEDIVRETAIGS